MIVSFWYLAAFILSGLYEGWRIYALIGSIGANNNALSVLDPGTAAYSQVQGIMTGNIIELVIVSVLLLLSIICIIKFIWYTIIKNAAYLLKTKTSDVIKTTNK